jgi:hypothetical protein
MSDDENEQKISLGFTEHKTAERIARLNEKFFRGDDTRLDEWEGVIHRDLRAAVDALEYAVKTREQNQTRPSRWLRMNHVSKFRDTVWRYLVTCAYSFPAGQALGTCSR